MADGASSTPPIRVEAVSKAFDRVVALDSVSLEIRRGEIFGLLGPNGAGKTTLIRTILDIIRPDTGRVELFGHAFRPEDRDRVGYLPEERGLYARQKVGAVLEYLATLKGMTQADARTQAAAWLARFELRDAIDTKVEQLSKGNQQKIQIISTLLANPPILILDEPLSGLDPISARIVNTVIRERAAAGQTVLLSTHQMGMVEALCTRVFMIAHGRRVLYGDLREIKREHSTDAVRVQSSADYAACPLVARIDGPSSTDRPVDVHLRDGARGDDFLRWLVSSGASVESFERMTTPLEEIFVKVAQSAGSV
jgi:ABC-2 type transport system ATP-binding protein